MRTAELLIGKLVVGSIWLFLALLTWLWVCGIYKSIGRVRTLTDAGEFLTPNHADVYPILFAFCAFLLVLATIWFRRIPWPWAASEKDAKSPV